MRFLLRYDRGFFPLLLLRNPEIWCRYFMNMFSYRKRENSFDILFYSNNFLLCVIQVAFRKNGPYDDLYAHFFPVAALCSISPTHMHSHSFVHHPIIIIILSHFSQLLFITDAPLHRWISVWTAFYWRYVRESVCVCVCKRHKNLIVCHIPGNRSYFGFFLSCISFCKCLGY